MAMWTLTPRDFMEPTDEVYKWFCACLLLNVVEYIFEYTAELSLQYEFIITW